MTKSADGGIQDYQTYLMNPCGRLSSLSLSFFNLLQEEQQGELVRPASSEEYKRALTKFLGLEKTDEELKINFPIKNLIPDSPNLRSSPPTSQQSTKEQSSPSGYKDMPIIEGSAPERNLALHQKQFFNRKMHPASRGHSQSKSFCLSSQSYRDLFGDDSLSSSSSDENKESPKKPAEFPAKVCKQEARSVYRLKQQKLDVSTSSESDNEKTPLNRHDEVCKSPNEKTREKRDISSQDEEEEDGDIIYLNVHPSELFPLEGGNPSILEVEKNSSLNREDQNPCFSFSDKVKSDKKSKSTNEKMHEKRDTLSQDDVEDGDIIYLSVHPSELFPPEDLTPSTLEVGKNSSLNREDPQNSCFSISDRFKLTDTKKPLSNIVQSKPMKVQLNYGRRPCENVAKEKNFEVRGACSKKQNQCKLLDYLQQYYTICKKSEPKGEKKITFISNVLEGIKKNCKTRNDFIEGDLSVFITDLAEIHKDLKCLRHYTKEVFNSFSFCLSTLLRLLLDTIPLKDKASVENLKNLNFLAFRCGIILEPGNPTLVAFLLRQNREDVLLELFHFWSFIPGVIVQTPILSSLLECAIRINHQDLLAIALEVLASQPLAVFEELNQNILSKLNERCKYFGIRRIHPNYERVVNHLEKLADLFIPASKQGNVIKFLVSPDNLLKLVNTFMEIPVARSEKLKRFILEFILFLFEEKSSYFSSDDSKKCKFIQEFIITTFRKLKDSILAPIQLLFLEQLLSTVIGALQWTQEKRSLSSLLSVSFRFGLKPWNADALDVKHLSLSASKEIIFLLCVNLKTTISPMESFDLLTTTSLQGLPWHRLLRTTRYTIHGLLRKKPTQASKVSWLLSSITLFQRVYDNIEDEVSSYQSFDTEGFMHSYSSIVLEGLRHLVNNNVKEEVTSAIISFYFWSKGKHVFKDINAHRGLVVLMKKNNYHSEALELFKAGQRGGFYPCCHLSDHQFKMRVPSNMTSEEINLALEDAIDQYRAFTEVEDNLNLYRSLSIEVFPHTQRGPLSGETFLDTSQSFEALAIRRVRLCCESFFNMKGLEKYVSKNKNTSKLFFGPEVIDQLIVKLTQK